MKRTFGISLGLIAIVTMAACSKDNGGGGQPTTVATQGGQFANCVLNSNTQDPNSAAYPNGRCQNMPGSPYANTNNQNNNPNNCNVNDTNPQSPQSPLDQNGPCRNYNPNNVNGNYKRLSVDITANGLIVNKVIRLSQAVGWNDYTNKCAEDRHGEDRIQTWPAWQYPPDAQMEFRFDQQGLLTIAHHSNTGDAVSNGPVAYRLPGGHDFEIAPFELTGQTSSAWNNHQIQLAEAKSYLDNRRTSDQYDIDIRSMPGGQHNVLGLTSSAGGSANDGYVVSGSAQGGNFSNSFQTFNTTPANAYKLSFPSGLSGYVEVSPNERQHIMDILVAFDPEISRHRLQKDLALDVLTSTTYQDFKKFNCSTEGHSYFAQMYFTPAN